MAAPDAPFSGTYPHLCVNDLVNGDTVDSDSVDSGPFYGFHVLTSGTVKFNTLTGTTKTLVVTAGTAYPYGVSRLWTTGHTTLTPANIELFR